MWYDSTNEMIRQFDPTSRKLRIFLLIIYTHHKGFLKIWPWRHSNICRRFQARHVYTSLTLEIPAKMIIELQEVHRSYGRFLSRFLIFLSNKMIIVCKEWLVSQICNNLYRNHDYHPKLFPEFFRVVFSVKSKIPIT